MTEPQNENSAKSPSTDEAANLESQAAPKPEQVPQPVPAASHPAQKPAAPAAPASPAAASSVSPVSPTSPAASAASQAAQKPVPPAPASNRTPTFEELADAKATKPPVAPAKPAVAPPAKPVAAAATPSATPNSATSPAPAKPVAAKPAHAPAKPAVKPKPASAQAKKPNASISVDQSSSGTSVAGLVIDALAAAAAIAFTVLIAQDALPFLK